MIRRSSRAEIEASVTPSRTASRRPCADVVIANRTEEEGYEAARELEAETGADALAVPTDVRNEDDVRAMVDETVAEFGGVDVLVNNAGMSVKRPAEEKPVDEFRNTLEVNLGGAFLCAKHAVWR